MSPNPSGAPGSLTQTSAASTDPFLSDRPVPAGPGSWWLRALKFMLLASVVVFGLHCSVAIAATDSFLSDRSVPAGLDPVWLSVVKYLLLAPVATFGLHCSVAITAIWRAPEHAAPIVEANGKVFVNVIAPIIEFFRSR